MSAKFDASTSRFKVGSTAVASATAAPLHVAAPSTDVQAIFGDNLASIDDPQIRVIGRDSANSAIRYLFTGLDADANHGFIGYNAGAGAFVNALTFDTSGNVNIGSTAANKTLEIKGASNNDGYLGTFGSGFSLQVARHPLTGAFNNTSTAAAAINLFTASGDSAIAFYTTASNNVNPTERMRIDKNLSLIHI